MSQMAKNASLPDIRALIFDLDGVITDTADYHFLSWKRLADDEGLSFTREDNEALKGVSRRESLRLLLKGKIIDEPTAQTWMTRKNEYYLGYLTQITPANMLSGVPHLLQEAKAAGLKTAVASASKNAIPVLERLGILDQFDAVGDGYSVVNGKPAPDLFVWAAGRVNVYPPQAVVFEDSEAGIIGALAGGFWTVGIGSANIQNAHIVVADLAAFHLSDMITHLQLLDQSSSTL